MIVAALDRETVARTRLAASPAAEAVSWLRLAAAGRRDLIFGDPGPSARAALAHPDVALVAELMPPGGVGYCPDFLTPQPARGTEGIEHQLAAVRAAGEAELDHEVRTLRFGGGALPRAVQRRLDDGSLAARAANGLARFWRDALRPDWPRLNAILTADLAHRAQVLGTDGGGGLLRGLHPSVDWDGSELRIQLPPWEERIHYHDAELVLSPGLFGWPAVAPQLCEPRRAVLRYPAHGLGRTGSGRRGRAVATLIGATRARLLADLEVARSTRALSERHRLAPATVSYHLGVLRDCGLVTATRDGRRVLYRRSLRADLLGGD